MGYGKVLTVVNEQTASTVAARYAITLALACQAELVLYAAHDEGSSENLLRQTDRHLDHLFTSAFELDIPVTRITEVGSISKLLPRRVDAEQADLVWYPLMSDDQYGYSHQRQTVSKLLHAIRSDLVLMRTISMAKPHPRHILIPFASSISDRERRLQFISSLARSFQAQVTLLHLSAGGVASEIPEAISSFRRQLQRLHLKVHERTGKGPVARSIAVEAITRHHDLIVLGASERGLLRRLLLGNPAGDLIHQPPCNTILFRPALNTP